MVLNLNIGISCGNQVMVAWQHSLKKQNHNHITIKSLSKILWNSGEIPAKNKV